MIPWFPLPEEPEGKLTSAFRLAAFGIKPDEATALARGLPKLPKQVLPEKIPSWSGNVVFAPYVRSLIGKEVLSSAKDKLDRLKNELNYIIPNPYEPLINEAVNRHLSK